jgi:hypothetical protein
MKNSNVTIGNRSCDLPVCSAVPQPTAPPRAPPPLPVQIIFIFPKLSLYYDKTQTMLIHYPNVLNKQWSDTGCSLFSI